MYDNKTPIVPTKNTPANNEYIAINIFSPLVLTFGSNPNVDALTIALKKESTHDL